jgi:hypothetical protein
MFWGRMRYKTKRVKNHRVKETEPTDLPAEAYLDFECSLETTSKEPTKWTNYRTED